MDIYTLDDENNVIPRSMDTFRELPFERRVVKQEAVGTFFVSTVFLELDHRFGKDGPLIVFETAVQDPKDNFDVVRRYSTWEDAEKGHKEVVAELIK